MNSNAEAVLRPIHQLASWLSPDFGLDFVNVCVFASASILCCRSALRFVSSESPGLWWPRIVQLTFKDCGNEATRGEAAATIEESVSRQGNEFAFPKVEMDVARFAQVSNRRELRLLINDLRLVGKIIIFMLSVAYFQPHIGRQFVVYARQWFVSKTLLLVN